MVLQWSRIKKTTKLLERRTMAELTELETCEKIDTKKVHVEIDFKLPQEFIDTGLILKEIHFTDIEWLDSGIINHCIMKPVIIEK